MFSKTTLLATVLGFVVFYLSAWFFYDMLAVNFFTAHNNVPMADAIDPLMISLGALIQSFIMANGYRLLYTDRYSVKTGFQLGTGFGLFVGFGMGLLQYGTMQLMDISGTLVDGIWNIVMYGLIGATIGGIFKYKMAKSPTA